MNPFAVGMRVKAKSLVQDLRTPRIMEAGDEGTVTAVWPATVQVLPDGRHLTIEATWKDTFEEI